LEEHEQGNDKKDSGTATSKLQNKIAMMMDERCMLSQMIVGLAEKTVARTAYECEHSSEYWGGSCHGLV
jgi:hypothetical protein